MLTIYVFMGLEGLFIHKFVAVLVSIPTTQGKQQGSFRVSPGEIEAGLRPERPADWLVLPTA